MSVTLLRPYLTYSAGSTISLQSDVETSLINQGIAVAATSSPGDLVLTDAATIPAWDTSVADIATITLGGNRTMSAPTNLTRTTYILHVYQDAVGSRTLTWNAVFKWPGGVAPTLTTTASAHDIFSFVSDGTSLYGSFLPDVR